MILHKSGSVIYGVLKYCKRHGKCLRIDLRFLAFNNKKKLYNINNDFFFTYLWCIWVSGRIGICHKYPCTWTCNQPTIVLSCIRPRRIRRDKFPVQIEKNKRRALLNSASSNASNAILGLCTYVTCLRIRFLWKLCKRTRSVRLLPRFTIRKYRSTRTLREIHTITIVYT